MWRRLSKDLQNVYVLDMQSQGPRRVRSVPERVCPFTGVVLDVILQARGRIDPLAGCFILEVAWRVWCHGLLFEGGVGILLQQEIRPGAS